MSKQVPMEVFKVVTDALEELGERLREVAIIDELTIELSTSTEEKHNVPIKVRQHPERDDEFVLEFE